MTRIIMDLPEGLTEADIPALKTVIENWAKMRRPCKSKKTQALTRAEIKRVRCACLMRNTTFSLWIGSALGLTRGNVYSAISGNRNGPKANAIRQRVREEFGIQ